MPVIDANGCPINVVVEGPERAPVLMLCNSLGTDHRMWDPQVKPFTRHFRLVRYDRRGHGRSGVTKGPYSMAQLARDALAVMDGLGIRRTNWCGLSMGSMVGQWLGANAPERLERLVLSSSSCYYANKDSWNDRIDAVRKVGMGSIGPFVMERWFTKPFREREPAIIAKMTATLAATSLDGYVACCEAVRDMDHRELLHKIKTPTLLIAGRHDPATTVENAEFIRDRVSGAKLVVLEAAHISNVEQAEKYTAAVLDFLKT
jgi:3-oxoadipate enol-lactonase